MDYRPTIPPKVALFAIVGAVAITAAVIALPDAIMAGGRAVFEPWWDSLDAAQQRHWTAVFRACSYALPALSGALVILLRSLRRKRLTEATDAA